jgi:S1-C subfamily serine protease
VSGKNPRGAVASEMHVVTLAAMGSAGDEGHDAPDDDPLEADDDRPMGAPPDRMDRLWVHPAELSPVPPPARRSRRSALLVPLAAGALGAIAAVVVLGVVGAFDRNASDPQSQAVERRVAESDAALSQVARAVAPGLVLVTVKDGGGARQSTGVCVRHSGDILTSAATIGAAATADITMTTGEHFTAKVIGRDDATGLVLLEAPRPMRAAPISEEATQTGDSIWIFGAQQPGTTGPWISRGIVASADALVANTPGPSTGELLETDALGTAWSAGGALVDRTGAVSGIVLWPQDEHRGAFAVPIDRAIDISDELKENGYVAHGTMNIQAVDTPAGPQVVAVPKNSAAEHGGVKPGDIVSSVGSHVVLDVAGLEATLHTYGPGKVVEVTLVRAGQPLKVAVTLASTPPPAG